MSSTATYNGIREVNAFYQSVIEEVTVGLQTLFEDEKEEERNRLHAELANKLKEKKAKVDGGSGKGKKRQKTKAKPTGDELAKLKAEVKELEAALKKKPAKLFDPSTVVSDFRHLWLQKLRKDLASQSDGSIGSSQRKSTAVVEGGTKDKDPSASTSNKTPNVNQKDGADSSAEEEGTDKEDADDEPDTEPLCSDDDMSDDPDAMFDCVDVILCKSSEIKREKGGKWRIKLKEGVANLGGKDIIFKECNSDLLEFY